MLMGLKSAVVAAILTITTTSSAEPTATPDETTNEYPLVIPTTHLHLTSGEGTLRTFDNKLFTIPQGSHILTEDEWTKVDNEMIRLQDAETNLTTQNIRLRQTVSSWRPGWVTVLVTLGTGLAAGWYLHDKL